MPQIIRNKNGVNVTSLELVSPEEVVQILQESDSPTDTSKVADALKVLGQRLSRMPVTPNLIRNSLMQACSS